MICLAEMSEELICEWICYPSFFLTGLLFVGLAIPMVLKKIPPNPFYGWRTPKAYHSEAIWYEINRYSGRDILVLGVIQFVFTGLMLVLRFWNIKVVFTLLVPGNLLILVGGTVILMIRGFRYLKKL
jgi:uncharacterized membrane protein